MADTQQNQNIGEQLGTTGWTPSDYAVKQPNTVIRTNMYPGDEFRSNYNADMVASNARRNLETQLSDMVRSREIRGGRRRIERQKQRYRDILEDKLSAVEKGDVSYINGKLYFGEGNENLNGNGNSRNDMRSREMNAYLTDVINKTGSTETRVAPTLARYIATKRYGNPNMTEAQILDDFRKNKMVESWVKKKGEDGKEKLVRETDEKGNIKYRNMTEGEIYDIIRQDAEEFDRYIAGLSDKEFDSRFIAGTKMILSSPELWKSYAVEHKLPANLIEDSYNFLQTRGWNHDSTGKATPAANVVYEPNLASTPVVSVPTAGVLISGGGASGSGGGGTSQESGGDNSTATQPVQDAYALAKSVNPKSHSIRVKKLNDLDVDNPADLFSRLKHSYKQDGDGRNLPDSDYIGTPTLNPDNYSIAHLLYTLAGDSSFPFRRNLFPNYIGDDNNGNPVFILPINGTAKGLGSTPRLVRFRTVHNGSNKEEFFDILSADDIGKPEFRPLTDILNADNVNDAKTPAWTYGNSTWDGGAKDNVNEDYGWEEQQ